MIDIFGNLTIEKVVFMALILVIFATIVITTFLFIKSILDQKKYKKTSLPELFEEEKPKVEPLTVFELSSGDEEGTDLIDPETRKMMREAQIKPTYSTVKKSITNPFKK